MRRARKLLLLVLTTMAAVVGCGLAFVLLSALSKPNLRWRLDLTSSSEAALSDRTATAIAQVPEGSSITAFLFPEYARWTFNGSAVYPRAFARIRTLLEDARIHAQGRLEVQVLDSSSSPVEVADARQKLEREAGETLILQTPEQRQVLRFEDLFVITEMTADGIPARIRQERVDDALGDSALRLVRDRLPQVGVVMGYGGPFAEVPQAFSQIRDLLAAEGYEAVRIEGPKDAAAADLIWNVGQMQPFRPQDADAMAQWMEHGKPVFLALDLQSPAVVTEAWNEQLEERGIFYPPSQGPVCEPFRNQFEGTSETAFLEIAAEQLNGQHPVSRRLVEANRGLLFRGCRSMELRGGSNDYLRERLLRTGPNAWIDFDGDFQPGPREPRKIYDLAFAAERLFPSAEGQAGRTLAIGSSYPVSLDLTHNRDFVASALRWLLHEEDQAAGLIALESQPWRPSNQTSIRLFNLAVLAIPGSTLLLGFLVFWRRKR